MNYYERHIGDYLRDTVHLSLLEHGIYGRLLDIYYTREDAIPADKVMRLVGCRTDEEESAARDVLNEFFFLQDGAWHHYRCELELAKFREKSSKAKASAEASWSKRRANADETKCERNANAMRTHSDDNANAMRTQCDGNALQTPDTRHQEEIQSNLTVASARQAVPLSAVASGRPPIPDCPHREILALWAEVLPSMPQHSPSLWNGARADNLRCRWRETAIAEGLTDTAAGLLYFRRLFAYIGQSEFLTGRVASRDRRPFVVELAWVVIRSNWAKVLEGKFHSEQVAA